eukprot:m.32550 g.32550  ORF g.32550 m.32550 type:complete len:1691 (+) comp31668_c0_seq3:179-5251(+)
MRWKEFVCLVILVTVGHTVVSQTNTTTTAAPTSAKAATSQAITAQTTTVSPTSQATAASTSQAANTTTTANSTAASPTSNTSTKAATSQATTSRAATSRTTQAPATKKPLPTQPVATVSPSLGESLFQDSIQTTETYEYEGYDGWYNNLAHPDWGGADMTLTRRLEPAYADGVYHPAGEDRPNPINVSDTVMNGFTGQGSARKRTAMLTFFGQQVVEEILDAQRGGCPPEYFNIDIPKGHPQYDPEGEGGKVLPFLRTRYNHNTGYSPHVPREQLNEITPWIDGGLIYGTIKAWSDTLRSFKDGKLACYVDADGKEKNFPKQNTVGLPMANPPPPADHKLKSAKRFFMLGNPRGNENPFLLTMGVIWFRLHNWFAEKLHEKNGSWHDEQLFNRARQWTIATHQKIVMYDWLPQFLPAKYEPAPYKGYQRAVHPGVTHVFQSAAMRFGHTLVPPGVIRRDKNCTIVKSDGVTPGYDSIGKNAIRTCNSYWNPHEYLLNYGIDDLLRGMASQITEREDHIITEDLRGNVFGPLEFSRRDLMAINIQRGRDHGLPDYRTARLQYGLSEIKNWSQINPQFDDPDRSFMKEAIMNLSRVYSEDYSSGSSLPFSEAIKRVDIWPGGLLETTSDGPGELFSTIIKDQFERIRDADRFWFENEDNGLFTKNETEAILAATFKDIIMRVTNLTDEDLQDNVFTNRNPLEPNGNKTYDSRPFAQNGCPAYVVSELTAGDIDDCTEKKTFDYFTGSEAPFIVTFGAVVLYVILLIVLLVAIARLRQRATRRLMGKKLEKAKTKRTVRSRKGMMDNMMPQDMQPLCLCTEILDGGEERDISIYASSEPKAEITLATEYGKRLRVIPLDDEHPVEVWTASNDPYLLVIKISNGYDVIVKFDTEDECQRFVREFPGKLQPARIAVTTRNQYPKTYVMREAITKKKRQQLVEDFMREVFARATQPSKTVPMEGRSRGATISRGAGGPSTDKVLQFELSKEEFADSMGLKPNSLFVEQMFRIADKDESGFITFREMLDLLVIFNKGSVDDKLRLMFDLYDIDNSGTLEKQEFLKMTKTMLEMTHTSMATEQLAEITDKLFESRGLQAKDELTFEDFKNLVAAEKGTYESLGDGAGPGAGEKARPRTMTLAGTARATVAEAYGEGTGDGQRERNFEANAKETRDIPDSWARREWVQLVRYVQNYRLQIFWVLLFHLSVMLIFVERAYFYSVEREHAGLRRIAGYGVTITRGAASAMAFTYSVILIPMCRNTITLLRETPFNRFVPFDSLHGFHKHIAITALVYTLTHIIGHSINFYHIATQNPNDLTCLFRDYYHYSDELPKFQYWCWNTLTGVSAVLVTLVMATMYVFAVPYARRYAFKFFWSTHKLYIVFYALLVLHGCGRLVQAPLFYFYFAFPAVLFLVDKLISISRNRIKIRVFKAEILPSAVTALIFKRPDDFDYKSGQWVRIASHGLSKDEYHPFTLTSAPHEEHLSLHIRAVGPWTQNLRKIYSDTPYPLLYLDGPFGEGHQDWHRFDVSVMVGGGIGVTPFASILKDVVHKNKEFLGRMKCKKLYFVWVTRTQKQFEWLTDIIREVEDKDENRLVDIHIFITQFYKKFDLRTTMLYICERNMERVAGRSLFTGLRSVTHFGRPKFEQFFQKMKNYHLDVPKIGVFSCGPPPMTDQVNAACIKNNEFEGPIFHHHFENF